LILDGIAVPQTPAPDYLQLFSREPSGGTPRCPSLTSQGEKCSILRFIETLPNGDQAAGKLFPIP
jgi:hypothetical protein